MILRRFSSATFHATKRIANMNKGLTGEAFPVYCNRILEKNPEVPALIKIIQARKATTTRVTDQKYSEKDLPEVLDTQFIRPMVERTTIKFPTALKYFTFLFTSQQALDKKDHIHCLVDPDYLEAQLFRPLRVVGIDDPASLLDKCPEIALTVLPNMSTDSPGSPLEDVLVFLKCNISRKDLKSLLKQHTRVLTYPVKYVEKLYDYLTDEMRLESGSNIALMRQHAHMMRHRLPIRLVTSLAWRVPLVQIQARHQLAKSMNVWPPRQMYLSSDDDDDDENDHGDKSPTSVLNFILTCPPSKLGEVFSVPEPRRLTGRDVKIFEDYYKHFLIA